MRAPEGVGDRDPRFAAYWAAIDAEKALSDALRERYGADAGDARYWPRHRHSAAIRALLDAKLSADNACLEEMRRNAAR